MKKMKNNILILGFLILTFSVFAQNKSLYSPDPDLYKHYLGRWENHEEDFNLELLHFTKEFNGEIENMIIGYYIYELNQKIIKNLPVEGLDRKNLKIGDAPIIGGYDEDKDELVLYMNDPINQKRGKINIQIINDQLHWRLKPNPGEITFKTYDPTIPFSIPKEMVLKRTD